MSIHLDLIEDKIEFVEATNLKTLEKRVNEKVDLNKAIMLSVHSVSHQMHVNQDGLTLYTAVIHFKLKK